MMTEKNRKTSVLFLCDQKACEDCHGDICQHTTRIGHAVNGHKFLYDPVKFFNERCWVLVTDERIIFEEMEEDSYGEVFRA